MKNVYFISNLINNIISFGHTTKRGCQTLLKGDYRFIYDRSGILSMKVPRTNHLYKIKLQVRSSVCYINSECQTFKVNLGGDMHKIHYKVLQEIPKEEPIQNVPTSEAILPTINKELKGI